MKPLLNEARVDPKNGYAIGDGLYAHSGVRENNGSYRQFPFSVDGSGTGFEPSPEYSSNGYLDLSISKINSYLATFMNRIFIMQPFLDAMDLRQMRDDFIARYVPLSQHPTAAGVDDKVDHRWSTHGLNDLSKMPHELLLDDAMMFLVWALGATCEHNVDASLQKTKFQHAQTSNDQGYDAPGLVYFGRSVEIMSSIVHVDMLIHAQIYLLAGLYMGQLACVEESMSWFTRAGRVLNKLIREHKLFRDSPWTAERDLQRELKESSNLVRSKEQHYIILAAWSCIQLEGDVLAQHRLPSSGIHKIEDWLPLPHVFLGEGNGVLAHEEHAKCLERSLFLHTAQTFLWKRGNQFNIDLYGSDYTYHSPDAVCTMLRNHETTLDAWKERLPPAFQWCKWDPPSSDILLARLQAKYWEVRYVVDQHFLNYALHVKPYIRDGSSVREVLDAGKPREPAEVRIFEAIATMSDDEVRAGCQRCVDAAIQGTVAFDGIPGRLIVPNIYSTAHV